MATFGRRVPARAVIAVTVLAAVVAAALVFAANQNPAPERPSRASTTKTLPDGWVSFRLPDKHRVLLRPDQIDLAKPAPASAPLLVFLPATGARPVNYESFLETASAEGFAVLGLDYWNVGRSVAHTCQANARCYTMLQRNRFTGVDPSRFSDIGPENSILNRLKLALSYLKRQNPQGNWSQYTTAHGIDWSRVVMAGHSQGGGESGFIGHQHSLRGVLMFSSPVETYEDVAAGWLSRPGATPVSRMYAFDDSHDVYRGRIAGSWKRLGLGHEVVGDVPTGGHALLSTRVLGSPLQSHGRSVDDNMPRTPDGTPVFEPTWRFMLQRVGGDGVREG